LTESGMSLRTGQLTAVGGAGLILSITLAARLVELWPQCLALLRDPSNHSFWGADVLVGRCITELTPAKLIIAPELHQLDLFGDPSGFYESGRRVVSLHHWKSWHHVDVVNLGRVKSVCGDTCLLKRWRFRDNAVLSNGYSAVQYPGKIPDLDKMELTFFTEAGRGEREKTNSWEELGHSLMPVRPALEEGKDKISYRLLDATEDQDMVRQIYVNRVEGDEKEDRVFELFWLKNSEVEEHR